MDDGPVYDDGFTKVYLELEYSIKRRITQARYEQLRPKFNQQMNKIVSGVSDKRFLKDPRQPKFSDYLTKQLPFNLNSAKNTAIMRRLETNRGVSAYVCMDAHMAGCLCFLMHKHTHTHTLTIPMPNIYVPFFSRSVKFL